MKQTATYKLTQWDKQDRIQMEDFNGDNAKLEDALKSQAASLQSLQQSTTTSINNLQASTQTSIQNTQTTLQNSINSLRTSTNTSVTSLTNSVAKRGNCQISLVTYTGANAGVAGRPKSLSFSYRPLAVFIAGSGGHYCWASRGMTRAPFCGNAGDPVTFSWGERAVSWYGGTSAAGLDGSGYTYSAVVLLEIQ